MQLFQAMESLQYSNAPTIKIAVGLKLNNDIGTRYFSAILGCFFTFIGSVIC